MGLGVAWPPSKPHHAFVPGAAAVEYALEDGRTERKPRETVFEGLSSRTCAGDCLCCGRVRRLHARGAVGDLLADRGLPLEHRRVGARLDRRPGSERSGDPPGPINPAELGPSPSRPARFPDGSTTFSIGDGLADVRFGCGRRCSRAARCGARAHRAAESAGSRERHLTRSTSPTVRLRQQRPSSRPNPAPQHTDVDRRGVPPVASACSGGAFPGNALAYGGDACVDGTIGPCRASCRWPP